MSLLLSQTSASRVASAQTARRTQRPWAQQVSRVVWRGCWLCGSMPGSFCFGLAWFGLVVICAAGDTSLLRTNTLLLLAGWLAPEIQNCATDAVIAIKSSADIYSAGRILAFLYEVTHKAKVLVFLALLLFV